MTTKNRILTVLLSLALMVPVAAFASASAETGGDTAPIWFMFLQVKDGWPQTLEEDLVRQYVQEGSGVEYYVEQYQGDDYDTKLSLAFASGDYPDLFVARSLQHVAQFKTQGVIRPLDALLDQHGQDLIPLLREPDVRSSRVDGALWSLPAAFPPAELDLRGSGDQFEVICMRFDWLENLGLDVPETLDEFHDVLHAFVYDDPDGNGVDDTIGLTDESGSIWNTPAIVQAFGISAKGWHERDEKLVYGAMTPEYKEAIGVAREWYAEGLIDAEFPVLEWRNVEERIIAGKTGACRGHAWMPQSTGRVVPSLLENVPDAEFQPIYPVIGPYGDRGYRAADNALKNSRVISSAISEARAQRVMTLLNWYAQGENWLVATAGIQGTHWEPTADGRDIARMPGFTTAAERLTVGIGNPARLLNVQDPRGGSEEIYGYLDIANEYVLENAFNGYVPAYEDYPDLDTAIIETVTRVILGELPLSELDAMQEAWYRNGGQEITDQVNEWYQATR